MSQNMVTAKINHQHIRNFIILSRMKGRSFTTLENKPGPGQYDSIS